MKSLSKNWKGMLLALLIAVPSYYLGKMLPIIGGPVFIWLIIRFKGGHSND